MFAPRSLSFLVGELVRMPEPITAAIKQPRRRDPHSLYTVIIFVLALLLVAVFLFYDRREKVQLRHAYFSVVTVASRCCAADGPRASKLDPEGPECRQARVARARSGGAA